MYSSTRIWICAALSAPALAYSTASYAAEATTFAGDFSVPVFQQVDQNGVDLVTGAWRVRTPTISVGEGVDKQERGLEWTGQAWVHVVQPSLWQNSGKYTVIYKGSSHEFNGFGSGFSKRAPIDGTSLSCDTLMGGDGISYCRFTSREGDLVVFSGFYSPLTNYGPKFGLSALQFGNLGIQYVLASETNFGNPSIIRLQNNTYIPGSSKVKEWGYQAILYGTPLADYNYNKIDYTILLGDAAKNGQQTLKINTPNIGGTDDHYLMPKSTTQAVRDDFGNAWLYQVDSDRNLTAVTQPGGSAKITATYDSNHRVASLTTPAGTWNYAYTGTVFPNVRTTTATSPLGEVTVVKYTPDTNLVTEVKDPLNRVTSYNWDTNARRLTSVTYPEGNTMAFEYDARGNVTKKTMIAKDGQSSVMWQAAYPATCPAGGSCNQPIYTIDPNGNRTDFEYTGGNAGPSKITLPAANASTPRQVVINGYSGGRLVHTSTCMTQATCAGTADEVVKDAGYAPRIYQNYAKPYFSYIAGSILVMETEKATSGGQSLLTCHQYDWNGHRTMTTPPNANLASCPSVIVTPAAPGSNPPIPGDPRSAPTFPGEAVAGGGGGGGGGGGCGGNPCPRNP